jgi:isoleucyl-tRNA synthetase
LGQAPQATEEMIDEGLESRMEAVRHIIGLGRSARNRTGLKVRQPLSKLFVVYTGEGEQPDLRHMESLVIEELNVKKVLFLKSQQELYVSRARPNFKALGPRFGGSVNTVAGEIKRLTPEEVARLEKEGRISLSVDGKDLEITSNDVEIERGEREGMVSEEDEYYAVSLDTTITEALRNEGFAREFVNRTQSTRKAAGFEVTDRITIYYQATDRVKQAVQALEAYIKEETLALHVIDENRDGSYSQEWDIDGERVVIAVERSCSA